MVSLEHSVPNEWAVHVYMCATCTYMYVVFFSDPRPSQLGEGRPRMIERQIMFGDSAQDVAGCLGAPSKVFFKAEDKVCVCVTLCVFVTAVYLSFTASDEDPFLILS